jgi:hypothetical protein
MPLVGSELYTASEEARQKSARATASSLTGVKQPVLTGDNPRKYEISIKSVIFNCDVDRQVDITGWFTTQYATGIKSTSDMAKGFTVTYKKLIDMFGCPAAEAN